MFMPWTPLISDAKMRKHCTVLPMSGTRPIAGEFVREGVLAAKLILTLEDFDSDCFYWNGFTFVSEKMRHAMALGPSDIQYFEVDASDSAPVLQSKHYMSMHVPVTEDVCDLKNSVYTSDRLPGKSIDVCIPSTVAFRPEARPAHEIFYDRSFKLIYCTDEFALRVLKDSCSGAGFFHPSRFFDGGDKRFRTLRGVEEIVKWNTLPENLPHQSDSGDSLKMRFASPEVKPENALDVHALVPALERKNSPCGPL